MASGLYGPNEIGAAIYRHGNGQYSFGPWNEGTPVSVNVSVPSPPPGASFHGIIHTHPKGVPYPSKTDTRSGLKTGAKALCIFADGEMRCHQLVRGRR